MSQSSGALVIDDGFIKDWQTVHQQQLTARFTSVQHRHVQQTMQHELPDPSGLPALLLTLLSSVLPPSFPASWPTAVAAFIAAVLDRDSRAAPTDSGSIAQTAVVDALWLICQRRSGRDEAMLLSPAMTAHAAASVLLLVSGSQLDEKQEQEKQRLAAFGRELISAGALPLRVVQESLPEEALEALGIWSAKVVRSKSLQRATNEWYRQQKFNLLHEETEGYSRLIEALHSAFSSPQQQPAAAAAAAADSSRLRQQVTTLIGYFDLDPNRVVDLLLASYQTLAAPSSLPLFLSLLSCFPSSHLTQLLGFRLQQSSPPAAALLDVAAVLVREGLVPIAGVWTHLGGSDEEMARTRKDWLQEEEAKAAKVGMATVGAGEAEGKEGKEEEKETPAAAPVRDVTQQAALNKNDAPIIVTEPIATTQPAIALTQPPPFPSSPFLSQPHSHSKLLMLAALIRCHAWPQALGLLSYLQALDPVFHPAVSGALCGYVSQLLAPYHAALFSKYSVMMQVEGAKGERSVSGLGDVKVEVEVTDETLLSLPAALLSPLIQLAHFLYLDPQLFTQLCRVLSHVVALLRRRHTGAVTALSLPSELQSILCSAILPAYSLLPSAISHASSLWSVLSLLPYPLRYSLYGHWHRVVPSSHLLLRIAHSQTQQKTKYFRKRISTARVKECSRLLLKFAVSLPLPVFALILQQLQQFDNMIGPVVEMLRHMPPLVLDCVCWLVLLQAAEREDRLKEDGMNASHWLQSLASFSGQLHRRYPDVELEAELQYGLQRLKQNVSLDLILLRELIANMSGAEVYEEMSELQLEAKGGSRLLQLESLTVRSNAKNKKRSSYCLVELLTRRSLLLPLYCLLCTERDGIVFETEYEHVRLVAELHDRCADVTLALVEMVDAQLSDAEYAKAWPSLFDLCTRWGLTLADAMHVLRRVVHMQRIQANEHWRLQDERRRKDEEEAKAAAMTDDSTAAVQTSSKKPAAVHPFAALQDTLSRIVEPSVLSAVPVAFYALFWRLSEYHLYVPTAAYAAAGKKLKQQITAVEKAEGEWATSDEPRRKRETERLSKQAARLKEDEAKHVQDVAATLAGMRREKDGWLSSITREFFPAFLFHCLLPRVFVSPLDALYSARFIATVSRIGTPRFCVVLIWDSVLGGILPLIASSSAAEASRFGRFLLLILRDFHRCTSDRVWYETEAAKSPCFAYKINEPSGLRFTHPQMVQIQLRGHKKMLQAFSRALSSQAKQEVGNALLILVKVGSEWPKISHHGLEIEKRLEQIIAAEGKEGSSLRVLATRAHGLLQGQRKSWKDASFYEEQATAKQKPPAAAAAAPPPQSAQPPAATATVAAGRAPLSAGGGFVARPPVSPASSVSASAPPAVSATGDRGGGRRDDAGRGERGDSKTGKPAASASAASSQVSARAASPPAAAVAPSQPAAPLPAPADRFRKLARSPSPGTPPHGQSTTSSSSSAALNPAAAAFTPDSQRLQRATSSGGGERKEGAAAGPVRRGSAEREGGAAAAAAAVSREQDRERDRERERQRGAEAARDRESNREVDRGRADRAAGGAEPAPPAAQRPVEERKQAQQERQRDWDRERERERDRERERQLGREAAGGGNAAPPLRPPSVVTEAAAAAPSLPQKRRRDDSGPSSAAGQQQPQQQQPQQQPAAAAPSLPPHQPSSSASQGRLDSRDDGRNKKPRREGMLLISPHNLPQLPIITMQPGQQQMQGGGGGGGGGRRGVVGVGGGPGSFGGPVGPPRSDVAMPLLQPPGAPPGARHPPPAPMLPQQPQQHPQQGGGGGHRGGGGRPRQR